MAANGNKYDILQNIRANAYKRQKRREKRQLKKRVQPKKKNVRTGLPVPRNFKRSIGYTLNTSNRILSKEDFNQKKGFYIDKYLPTNLKYLLNTKTSPFFLETIKNEKHKSNGIVKIPKLFSIIEDPTNGYLTLKKVVSALLVENIKSLELNYEACEKVELGSQILLDIILMDYFKFVNFCNKVDRNHKDYFPTVVRGRNIDNEDVQKIINSVGSPVTLKVRELEYSDVIPYKLCAHDNEKEKDLDKRIEQKELDTTELADYVVDSLKRMNKELVWDKIDDLCTVIGEILINAEEHSSTKYRFSIGYFKEESFDNKHFGIFRLVILNFGKTIYEKFKDENCPNKEIVKRMEMLSKSYTRRSLFSQKEFEEENLWTLYALQDGVTSISPTESKRGNGSIRFIESFFNLKGSLQADDVSNMTILSGNTSIIFNGKYSIVTKTNSKNENFKVMTFNDSGDIEDIPDKNCVSQKETYFPGTLISVKILLNDDDIIQIKN